MISQTDLKTLAHYDEVTGVFTRKTSRGGFHIGTPMGRHDTYGYVQITLRGSSYLAHRLAWLYVYGVWPDTEIDHINCIRNDNSITNLRKASRQGNNQNIKTHRITNTCQMLGASPKDGKYQARISYNRKQYYLGFFNTKEEAHSAYVEAKRKLHLFNTI